MEANRVNQDKGNRGELPTPPTTSQTTQAQQETHIMGLIKQKQNKTTRIMI